MCLDTSVFIKYLVPDEQDEAASSLVLASLKGGWRMLAPSWVWEEVGSVLRKKIRMGLLEPEEADQLWRGFLALPLTILEERDIAQKGWELARMFRLPTLYEAAFLACVETATNGEGGGEFWTADELLIRQLGSARPAYVRLLGELNGR